MNLFFRYFVAALVIVIDQVTKVWVDNSLALGQQIPVTPMFNITLWYNEGASFSFLSDAGGWQRWLFTGISSVVSVVLVVWLFRLTKAEKALTWAIALILGGAVGNLIDRVLYGHVVDFIQWYYDKWYFPTFNVADAAISVGAVLLLISTFFGDEEEPAKD